MEFWERLEIDPTVDQRIIKRAYAKKLKQHHPEDDPEGFQSLRRAFEQAIEKSKHLLDSTIHNRPDKPSKPEIPAVRTAASETNESVSILQNQDPQVLAEELMNRVVANYIDFKKRTHLDVWKDVFSTEAFWNLEVKQRLASWIFQFVGDHPYLPADIYQLFENEFSWFYHSAALEKAFDQETVDRILRRIHNAPWSISYDGLMFPDSMEIDAIENYLHQREALEHFILQNDAAKVSELIDIMAEMAENDHEFNRLLSFYHVNNQRYDQAMEYCDRYITLVSAAVDGHLQKADIFYRKNNYTDAATSYHNVLQIDDEHPIALRGLAACYFEAGNLTAAMALYEQAVDTLKHDLEARIQLIRIHQMRLHKNREILHTNPDDKDLHLQIATSYYEIGAFEDCAAFIQAQLDTTDVSYDLLLLFGKVQEALGENPKAEALFRRALEAASNEDLNGFEAIIRLGVVLKADESYNEALDYLQQAQQLDPTNAFIISERADCHRQNQEFDVALELINEAILHDATHWIYFSIRGLIHFELKHFREAIPDMEIVLRHSRYFARMWFNKGVCHAELGEHHEAVDNYQSAIDCDRDYTDAYLDLASSLSQIGEFDKALEAVDQYQEKGGDVDWAKQWREKFTQKKAQHELQVSQGESR